MPFCHFIVEKYVRFFFSAWPAVNTLSAALIGSYIKLIKTFL